MFCGSCLRDNALAAELLARGHEVTLLPVYTPTLTDEPNMSAGRPVFYGGISVYLQQHLALFRHTPWLLDRLWDAPSVIRRFATGSIQVDPRMLGALTVSTLRGESGYQRKEVEKLVHYLAGEPRPDVVNLPNSMLIALAAPIRRALDRPIVVTLASGARPMNPGTTTIDPAARRGRSSLRARRRVSPRLGAADPWCPSVSTTSSAST